MKRKTVFKPGDFYAVVQDGALMCMGRVVDPSGGDYRQVHYLRTQGICGFRCYDAKAGNTKKLPCDSLDGCLLRAKKLNGAVWTRNLTSQHVEFLRLFGGW